MPFFGKIGKSKKFWEKLRKVNFNRFLSFDEHLGRVSGRKMIVKEIRGHLLILLFYRDQTRASDVLLRKKAMKFEVELLDTPNLHRIC